MQADFIHIQNKDMFLALGEPYSQQVWVMENTGDSKYDALNLSLEKRYANNWSGRVSYSLSTSRGTAENQADKNTDQVLTDLNLAARVGPLSVDRRHILSLSGRAWGGSGRSMSFWTSSTSPIA